jgi:hypothetical protein
MERLSPGLPGRETQNTGKGTGDMKMQNHLHIYDLFLHPDSSAISTSSSSSSSSHFLILLWTSRHDAEKYGGSGRDSPDCTDANTA